MPDRGGPDSAGKAREQPILIVAQNHTGHHLTYVRLLARAVLDAGNRPVLALTDDGRRSREFLLHLESVAGRCQVIRLATRSLSPSGLLRLARHHGCERVLVPNGDRFAIRLGLTVRPPREATFVVLVLLNPRWICDRRPGRWLRLGVKSLVLRRTGRLARTRLLYLADPSQPTAAPPLRHAGAAPDPVLFDAADRDPDQLRQQLGLASDRFWFLVAGDISPRKSLPLVLRALLPLAGCGVGLFVCGKLHSTVRRAAAPLVAEVESRGIPVVSHDWVQADQQLNCAIQAADCVIVAYSTDSPTSMMSKPVRAGRRVVVAGSPSLQRWAKNLGIGLVGPLDEAALTRLLQAALTARPPAPRPDLDHTAFVRAFLSDPPA